MTDVLSELDRLNSLDPHTITAIHNRYYADVYRFARFRVNDTVTAEDIAGDVFMRLLEAVHGGRGPTKNLHGWLIRTTANVVNNHFRKLYKQPIEDSTDMHEKYIAENPANTDPVIVTDQAEQRQVVKIALEKLTDAQKLVITLRFGNKFTLEETARIMGKNANTIKALQYRALISLRRNIGSELI